MTRAVQPVSVDSRTLVALRDSLEASLQRGHWRVACARYLKLLAACGDAPSAMRDIRFDGLLERCSPRERLRMRRDALEWVAFARSPAETREAQPAPIRTQWRPLPPLFRS